MSSLKIHFTTEKNRTVSILMAEILILYLLNEGFILNYGLNPILQ